RAAETTVRARVAQHQAIPAVRHLPRTDSCRGPPPAADRGAITRLHCSHPTELPSRDDAPAWRAHSQSASCPSPPQHPAPRSDLDRYEPQAARLPTQIVVRLAPRRVGTAPGPAPLDCPTGAFRAFLRGSAERTCAAVRLVPTRASGHPAFGCYLS